MKGTGIYKYKELSIVELLSLLTDRNEMALRTIYERFWNQLYIDAWKVLKNDKASEDVVQEVFIDLWEKKSYDHIDNFDAYIYQAVKYKTLMIFFWNLLLMQFYNSSSG